MNHIEGTVAGRPCHISLCEDKPHDLDNQETLNFFKRRKLDGEFHSRTNEKLRYLKHQKLRKKIAFKEDVRLDYINQQKLNHIKRQKLNEKFDVEKRRRFKL